MPAGYFDQRFVAEHTDEVVDVTAQSTTPDTRWYGHDLPHDPHADGNIIRVFHDKKWMNWEQWKLLAGGRERHDYRNRSAAVEIEKTSPVITGHRQESLWW